MKKSISAAVYEILGELHFLRMPFKYDLVNFSALARFIREDVEKRCGKEVADEAIIMAIRRQYSDVSREELASIAPVISSCKLVLRADFFILHLKPRPEMYSALLDLEKKVDWALGEKMYLLFRSDEITIIGTSKFLSQVMALVTDADVQEFHNDVALLTAYLKPEGVNAAGIFSFFADQFSAHGIPVLGCFHTRTILSFAMRESDSAMAYEKLSRAIKKYSGLGGTAVV